MKRKLIIILLFIFPRVIILLSLIAGGSILLNFSDNIFKEKMFFILFAGLILGFILELNSSLLLFRYLFQHVSGGLKDMSRGLKDMSSELKDMTNELKYIPKELRNMANEKRYVLRELRSTTKELRECIELQFSELNGNVNSCVARLENQVIHLFQAHTRELRESLDVQAIGLKKAIRSIERDFLVLLDIIEKNDEMLNKKQK